MGVGDELRARRLELDVSQSDLAERLHVSQQTVSRWENGSACPTPRRLAELAEILDVDAGSLLRSAGYLVANDVDVAARASSALDQLTTEELVKRLDEDWAHLRRRLLAPDNRVH